MAPWHLMIGFGIAMIATMITIVVNRRPIAASPSARKMEYTSPPDVQCPICLLNMSNYDIRYLRCGHGLHNACFEDLKKNKYTCCPLCRKDI